MMRADIVGGVHQLAENWVAADEDVRLARQALDEAEAAFKRAEARLTDISARLAERVGRNVPLKAFHIGTFVVLVEYERGIKRVPFEDRER